MGGWVCGEYSEEFRKSADSAVPSLLANAMSSEIPSVG